MRPHFSGLIMAVCSFLVPAVNLWGQTRLVQHGEGGKFDYTIVKPIDPRVKALEDAVNEARRANDMDRYQASLAQLEELTGANTRSSIISGIFDLQPVRVQDFPSSGGPTESWGNDIPIRTGDLRSEGNRQLALAADTLGRIYAAGHFTFQDTGSTILVYGSTNAGLTWGLVQGVQSPMRFQSFSMDIGDTAAGRWLIGLHFVLKTSDTSPGGSLVWVSFLDNGTNWRVSTVLAADDSTEYRNPTITTDAPHWSPGLTWWYGAAERVSPTSGISRGITAVRSTTWGRTWAPPDSAVNSVESNYPKIFYQVGLGANDTVGIAYARRFTTTDRDIQVRRNSITYSGTWRLRSVSISSDDEYDPDVAVSTQDASLIITYTRNMGNSGDWNALYARSTDGFNSHIVDTLAASLTHDEFYTSANYVRDGTNDEWRVGYKMGNDSVHYKVAVSIAGLHGASGQTVNQFTPSGVMRPVVGSHRIGPTGSWFGHMIYAGFGPSVLYYDGSDISVSVDDVGGIFEEYALRQNYPNPFNPSTTIAFAIPRTEHVLLKVYNVLGQEVATLANGEYNPGSYTVAWNARNVASGIYYYRIQAGGYVATKAMVILR